MSRIPVNGAYLYVEDSGPAESGETIVFSYGLLWNTRLFDHQVKALHSRFRCVAYDHRGQGRSDSSRLRSIDMDLLCRDAAALIETLGLGAVHFCGLSMGGFVGMRFAARRPDLVKTLILLDTTARAERPERIRQYRLLNYLSRWFGYQVVVDKVMRIKVARSVLEDPAHDHDRNTRERRG